MATQYSRGGHQGRVAVSASRGNLIPRVLGAGAIATWIGLPNIGAATAATLGGVGAVGAFIGTGGVFAVAATAAWAVQAWRRRRGEQREQYMAQREHLEEQRQTELAETQQQHEQAAATAFEGEIDNTFDALYAHSAIVASLHDGSQRLTGGIESLLNPPSHDPSSSGIDWNEPNQAQPELERLLTAFNQQRQVLLNQLGQDDPSLGLSGIPELTIDDLVTINATGSLEINELNVRALGARLGQVNATAATINSSVKTLRDGISAYDGTPAGRESLRKELTLYTNRLQGFGRTVASIREPGATMPPRRSSAPSSGTSGGSPVPGTPAVGRTAEPTPPDTVLSLVAGWVARRAHHAAETRTGELSTTLDAQLRSHQALTNELDDLDNRVIPELERREGRALGDVRRLQDDTNLRKHIAAETRRQAQAQKDYEERNTFYQAQLESAPGTIATSTASTAARAAGEELDRVNQLLTALRAQIDAATQAFDAVQVSLELARARRVDVNEQVGRLDGQRQATGEELRRAERTAERGGPIEQAARRVAAGSQERGVRRFSRHATTPVPVSAQPGSPRRPSA